MMTDQQLQAIRQRHENHIAPAMADIPDLLAEVERMIEIAAELEAQLAEARKNALEWRVYDGTPESLPEWGYDILFWSNLVPIKIQTGYLDKYISSNLGGCWNNFSGNLRVTLGDRWAYLPDVEVGE